MISNDIFQAVLILFLDGKCMPKDPQMSEFDVVFLFLKIGGEIVKIEPPPRRECNFWDPKDIQTAVFYYSLHIHHQIVHTSHFPIFSRPKPGGGVYLWGPKNRR